MKTKLHFQRFFASLLLLALSAISWAYDFVVDNIYYNKNSDGKSVTVTYRDNYYHHSGKVTIPSWVTYSGKTYSVTSIGEGAFSDCSGLTSITIPGSVTSIGDYAFAGCSGLTSITIPGSVTSIYSEAFYGCENLTKAEFASIESLFGIEFVDYYSNPLTYAHHLYINGSEVTNLVIPGSVTSIAPYAFCNCSGLTSVTIPSSVTRIGYDAFRGCSGLTSVIIGNNVTSIGVSAFAGCTALTSVTCLAESIPTMESNVFYNVPQSFAKLYVPVLALNAYKTAEQWKKFGKILEIATVIKFADANLKAICVANWDKNGNGELEKDEAVAVTSLGEVFKNNTTITSFDELQYFTGLTKISENAFYGCSGLTSIDIPNSVTSIGRYAFEGCSCLTSITIPNSVTSIGSNAFYNCSSLKSVTCLAGNVPTMGSNVFYNVPQSSAMLYVPTSSVNAYKTTEQWKDFGTICSRVYAETDVTAQFPVDWQGWNGATGYVGGAAPKVTTNDGRETPACEKFNGSSAALGIVFTRTLSGLTNGTYRIELYGAAASTRGRDTNIDSNMIPSDEGDETAVYLYAQTAGGTVKQYIPVHWATSFSEIATAVLNGVEVTDGTVEIGMVSDKKFTNWHVVQIKGVTALVDAVELHKNTLTTAQEAIDDAAYVNVIGSERTALSQAIANYSVVSEQTTEAYQEAINALETATKALTDAKESYDAWANIKNHSFPYASKEKKTAAESAAAVSPTSAADAANRTEIMLPLYRQYAESSAMLEGVNGAINMTSYIKNPKADEAIDASVWQTVLGAGSGGSIGILDNEPWTDGNGSTAHRYFDGGNWGDTSWDVTLKQNVALPAGVYQLTAIGRSSKDVTLTLFAGEETAEMAHIGATGGLFNRGWEQTSVVFELENSATVGIGVRGVTPAYHNWMSFSDFRLVQFTGYILSGKCGENLNYILTDDYVLTISGTGAMYYNTSGNEVPWYSYRESITSVVIDNGVTSIGNYAFQGCSGLTSIDIPNSVTSIGDHAFIDCTGLTSITIPNSVTRIGQYAFYGCSGLTSINIPNSVTSIGEGAFGGCSGLTSINIPNSVTSIDRYVFQGCSSLTSITIPNSVTSIGESAFRGCSGLTSITIPNSVTSIGLEAFDYCSNLTSINIPESVTSIDDDAFDNCEGLTSIIVASGNTVYDSRNNCNAIIETATNTLVVGCKNTVIPNSVTSIRGAAFHGCSGLTSITIPNSVTSIGRGAFSYCSGLTSINIPNSVTSIGDWGFCGCSSLTSVTIPESVTNIGEHAFTDCSGLTSVTCLAESVPTTGTGVFSNVPRSSATLYVPASALNAYTTAEQWKKFGKILVIATVIKFADANVKAICVANWDTNGDGELDEDEAAAVTDLGEMFKENTSITSFDELQYFTGLATIVDQAFSGCSNLALITIPNSVTSIGKYAFWNCTGLTSITIPNSVTSIGRCAFEGCSGLTSITIPNSVTDIGYLAFADCTGLTSIVVASGNTKYDSRNNCNAIIETATNTLVIGCKNTVIPNSVTSIGEGAFEYCSSLTSINIPNSVTSIGNNAFAGCSGLTSIDIPNSVTNIAEGAFGGCSGLTSINIPNSVTSIGGAAFDFCTGLTSINIPNSVTSIGGFAFEGCSGLTSITIPTNVTSIGTRAFNVCSGLTSVTCLAESVPTMGTSVFSYVPISSATLYVPASALNAYKAANQWKEFGTILPTYLYIETDVTSQFPIDWQGWNGATGYVGWAAPQVTTNDGRTTPACEKFNDSSAALGTVFTRTLTGLVNGTYRIELYGAAASTKSRDTGIDTNMTSADEGDETAVYLYAKTASGTVKQYIPAHWALDFNTSGIATATLNGVEVTDGTVEIGMVSDKKFTNWHVVQIKGVTALVDAIALHEKTLTRAQEALNDAAYINVVGSERTVLSQTIATYSVVSEYTAEAYLEAINALDAATSTYTIAKESYDAWANFKNISFPYASDAKKNAAEAAAAVLPTNAANAVSRTETMLPLYRQYAESSAMLEGVEGATNMTSYIKNPKAEQAIDASVWQTVLGEGSGGNISIWTNEPWTDGNGSTDHKYFDGGNWDDTSWDVAFKQNVTLPAGRYQLTAIGRSSGDVTLTLFAGEETAEMAHIGATGGLFNRGWEQTSVEFELTTGATVGIGVRGVTPAYHNWMSFSDFRLVQFPGGDTGIDSMQTNDKDAEDDDSIYDLNGRKLSKKPENGYYIQGGKLYRVK